MEEDMDADVSIEKAIITIKSQQQNSTPIITKNNQEESLFEAQKVRISKRLPRRNNYLFFIN